MGGTSVPFLTLAPIKRSCLQSKRSVSGLLIALLGSVGGVMEGVNEPALVSKDTAVEQNRKAESGVRGRSPESHSLQFKLLIFKRISSLLDFNSLLKILTGSFSCWNSVISPCEVYIILA